MCCEEFIYADGLEEIQAEFGLDDDALSSAVETVLEKMKEHYGSNIEFGYNGVYVNGIMDSTISDTLLRWLREDIMNQS